MSTMQVVAYLHRSAIDGGKPQADTQHYNLADARPLVFESDALAAIQDASRAAHQARAVPAVPEGLIEVLRGGRQCDEDGTEIIMSRQACCEAADLLETMGSQPPAGQQDRCEELPKLPIQCLMYGGGERFGGIVRAYYTADQMREYAMAAIKAANGAATDSEATAAQNEWKQAILDALSNTYTDFPEGTDPKKILDEIINWHVCVALDPEVSSDAQTLIDKGIKQTAPKAEPAFYDEPADLSSSSVEQDDAPPGWKKTAYGWAQSGETILAAEQANGTPGADAERLDWLEKHKQFEARDGGYSGFFRVDLPGRETGPWAAKHGGEFDHKTLRDAIDAARDAQREAE